MPHASHGQRLEDFAYAKEGVTAFLEKRPARFVNRVSQDMPGFFPWWDARPYE